MYPLKKNNLQLIVKERLPNLQKESIEILVQRCQGDIDLLNDFIDEIVQSIGWMKDGQLVINPEKLYELPSKSIEMAKSRLFSYPENIRQHLVWSSLQGIIFDYEIINSLVSKFDNSFNL